MSNVYCEGFEESDYEDDVLSESSSSDDNYGKLSKRVEQARCVLSRSYPLEPDMLHGWVPKIPSIPIPLYYSENLQKIKQLIREDSMYKIVYEWNNSKYNTVKLHQSYTYKWQKRQKYEMNLGFLEEAVQKIGKPKVFRKDSIITGEKQVHIGQYRFESDFESGNLQLAVRVKPDEYDCYLRSDSNTNGHTNWFYFTVQNFNHVGQVKINICNLKKHTNLYGKGMSPYLKSNNNEEWSQSLSEQVNFVERYCRYRPNVKCYHLQFKYTFKESNQRLRVAYCIPYTYSQLQQFLQSISTNKNVESMSLGQSFTGLSIPLLKITNPKKSPLNKKAIVMIGRTHPGEANSSWVIQGIIKELLAQSNSSRFLRDKFEFWIVPMLNVDGVVLGNFRCGGQGLDFNRCFSQSMSQKAVEIAHVMSLIKGLKERGSQIEFVVDFHGHSEQKNCFFYGPQSTPSDRYFFKSRLFAKMFEQKCQSFRFNQSCFHIPEYKKNTARSYMNRVEKIPMVFTLEVSNGLFQINKVLRQYNRKEFELIGKNLLLAICEFEKTQQLIDNNLKLIEMKKTSNFVGSSAKNRQSVKVFEANKVFGNRSPMKRSSMKIDKSTQMDKAKLTKKRSSQNLSKIWTSDYYQKQYQSRAYPLIDEKIKIMIDDICEYTKPERMHINNTESDIQSEENDFTKVQRQIFNNQIQEWSSGFYRKSVSQSIRKQKSQDCFVPKVNNLFENCTKQTILKYKKQRQSYKDLRQQKDPQTNQKNQTFKNGRTLVPNRNLRSSQTSKKYQNVYNGLNKTQVIEESGKKNSRYGFGVLIKDESDLTIEGKENSPVMQRSNIYVQTKIKFSTMTDGGSPTKDNLFPLKLSQASQSSPGRKLIKNSLWSNSHNKNILRSNRFPFVMEKFI